MPLPWQQQVHFRKSAKSVLVVVASEGLAHHLVGLALDVLARVGGRDEILNLTAFVVLQEVQHVGDDVPRA